jgi:hypothetical protein
VAVAELLLGLRDHVGAGDEAKRRLLQLGNPQQRVGELGRIADLVVVLSVKNSRRAAARSA